MDAWVIWLIAAVVFGVGEIATLGFFLAPFAGGALVAALLTGVGAGTAVGWAVFLVVSVVLLAALRPIALSHRRQAPLLRTGTAALVGKSGMVVERIANDEGVGCVRIDGEVWTARSYDDDDVMEAGVIALIVLAVFLFIVAASGVRIVPQARAGIVERLGRYTRTLDPGLALIVPFIDRVKPLLDLREQVVSFPPQPVITEDNLVVGIDTVIYFTITDPKAATYEVANPLQAIEQLTVTTLRNVIGGMTLEETLTSRDHHHPPPRR